METIYPFKWLDSLVTNTLSPGGPAFITLGREEIKSIIESLEATKQVLPMDFLYKLLSLKNEQQCKTLVNRYHHQFVLLKEEIKENLASTKKNYPEIYRLSTCTHEFVEYLLSLLETRFPQYLRNNSFVSDKLRAIRTSTLKKQLRKIQGMNTYKDETVIHDIVLPIAEATLGKVEITFGQLNYWGEINTGLIAMSNLKWSSFFSAIEEFLINMDFNHKWFSEHIQHKISQKAKDNHQILLIARENFEEIIVRQDVRYTLTHQSLVKTMRSWFSGMILNVEKNNNSTTSVKTVHNASLKNGKQNKITIRLSVDQYGILLRAADQTRLLDAPSFTHICETIAPIIATPERNDISPRSLRSNSYPSEESDKLVAIRSLEKMIRWIREC